MQDIASLLAMLSGREPDAFQSNDLADARQQAWNTRPSSPAQSDGRFGTSFYSSPDAGSGGDGRFGTSWFSQPSAIQAATMGRGQRGPNGEEVSTGGGTTRVNYDPRYAQFEPQAQRIYNGSPGAFAQVGNTAYPHGLDDTGIGDTSQMSEAQRLDALRRFMRLKNIPGANQNLFEEQITGMSPIYRQAQMQKMQQDQSQTDEHRTKMAVDMQTKRLAEQKSKEDALKAIYGGYDANGGDFDNVQYGYGGNPSSPFLHVTPHPRIFVNPDTNKQIPIQDPAYDRPVAAGDLDMASKLRAALGYDYGRSATYNGIIPPSGRLMGP